MMLADYRSDSWRLKLLVRNALSMLQLFIMSALLLQVATTVVFDTVHMAMISHTGTVLD